MDCIKVKEYHSPYHCFIVPSERLEGAMVQDIQYLQSEERKYQVIDIFRFSKDEALPLTFLKIISGIEISEEKIWKSYPASDEIYVFSALPLK